MCERDRGERGRREGENDEEAGPGMSLPPAVELPLCQRPLHVRSSAEEGLSRQRHKRGGGHKQQDECADAQEKAAEVVERSRGLPPRCSYPAPQLEQPHSRQREEAVKVSASPGEPQQTDEVDTDCCSRKHQQLCEHQ